LQAIVFNIGQDKRSCILFSTTNVRLQLTSFICGTVEVREVVTDLKEDLIFKIGGIIIT
jgi:hypothetical protein